MHGQVVSRARNLIILLVSALFMGAGISLYLEQRTNAEFTHGLCPDCREKLYPELPSGRKM